MKEYASIYDAVCLNSIYAECDDLTNSIKVVHKCTKFTLVKCHPYNISNVRDKYMVKVILFISMMFEHPHKFVRQNYKINFLQSKKPRHLERYRIY